MSIEYDKSDGRWVTDVTVVTWLVSYLISVLFSQICCDTWVQVGWTITIRNFENVVDLWPNRPGAELSWKGPLSARWLTVRQPQRKSSSVESTSAQVAKTSVTVNDSCSFKLFTPGRSDHMISCFLRVQTVHLTVEYMVDKISHELLLHFLSFRKFNISLAFKSENVQGH